MNKISSFCFALFLSVLAFAGSKPTIYRGHIVDVITREIYDGEIVIKGDTIVKIKRCKLPKSDAPWPYIMPGFIDSHVHVESSMITPQEYARMAVCHGTIGVMADPHEIVNVNGVPGLDFMIQSGRQAQFNFFFGLPSSVPALGHGIETSGAVIDADATERLMAREDVGFLAEMMNYSGVLNRDEQVMRKIAVAHRYGKRVDGHAPDLPGDELKQYAAVGITTNHECSTLEEGLANIAAGMKVLIREGSTARNYDVLVPLLRQYPDMVMFCTDDYAPEDLVKGHINLLVCRALADGYGFWDVLRAVTYNPQQHYGLRWGLLQKGDPATFILVDNLTPQFHVQRTIIKGVEVFNSSRPNLMSADIHPDNSYLNNFKALPITGEDIHDRLHVGDTLHVIVATDGSLLTQHERIVVSKEDQLPDGIQKIVVYCRYEYGAKPVVGYIKGFNMTNGAMAGTVAHDCHNIVAIGSNDDDLRRVINRVIELRGGLVAVSDGEMAEIRLPIAGLMSPYSCAEVVELGKPLYGIVKHAGCQMNAPFITMAFMCLPVIPELKITDKGVIDTTQMKFIK